MMANENEKLAEEEEPKIPVFTILKNGAVIKNIFIVNKPPPPHTAEEILIVGRHPDCNIVLTHPSVSRFHLQILSNPSSHKLSVTNLSSGTLRRLLRPLRRLRSRRRWLFLSSQRLFEQQMASFRASLNSLVGPKTTHCWDLLRTGHSLLLYA